MSRKIQGKRKILVMAALAIALCVAAGCAKASTAEEATKSGTTTAKAVKMTVENTLTADGEVVSSLEENAPVDLTVGVSMLSRLIYGYDGLTAQQAAFVDDISQEGNAEDFFRAFGKKASGVFEHF
jgi:hypothetical protein